MECACGRNRDSKKRYRADVLIEDHLAKFDEKIDKETAKAAKRFGEAFDREQFLATSPRVAEIKAKRDALYERFAKAMNDSNLEERISPNRCPRYSRGAESWHPTSSALCCSR